MVHGDETLDPGMGDIGHIQPSQLQRGWDVFGSEGDKIGDLEEVRDEYIIVSRGFLFTTERFIPLWAVSTAGDGKVFLNVTKDEIETRGWDNAEAVARSRPAGTGEMRGRETRASQTDEMLGRETRAGDTGEMLGRETRTSPTGETEERMEIREEELRTRKREVEAGAVDVEREVVTERETREVPVTREEVDVEYRPVDSKPATQGELSEEEIHVPIHEEEVTVDKETVVTGEVEVRKRQVQDTEEISEEVRKERPRIRGEGDVTLDAEESHEEHPH